MDGIDKIGKHLFHHFVHLHRGFTGAEPGVPFQVQKKNRYVPALLFLLEQFGIGFHNAPHRLGNKRGEVGQFLGDFNFFLGDCPVILGGHDGVAGYF